MLYSRWDCWTDELCAAGLHQFIVGFIYKLSSFRTFTRAVKWRLRIRVRKLYVYDLNNIVGLIPVVVSHRLNMMCPIDTRLRCRMCLSMRPPSPALHVSCTSLVFQ